VTGRFELGINGMQDATAIRIDEPHVFVTVTTTAQPGKDDNKLQLVKLDKNLRNVGTYTFEAKDNVPFGLEIDMDYIYTGQYALPGVVLKISKDTMKLVSRLVLPDGANDIRQLESDPTDPYDEYIYANTNTQPGQILKIRKNGLTLVSKLVLAKEEAYPLAGIELDADFLYVGTNTSPGRVLKIDKHLMKRVDHVTLGLGDDNLAALESDAQFLFAACYTKPGKIVRIDKNNMKKMDELTLNVGEDMLTSLAHGMAHIYAGTYTKPGKIVEIFGYEQPVNCEIGDWGYWSTPTQDCGGSQTRTRAVIQPAYFGGKDCGDAPMVQARNYTAPWCALTGACTGGKIFTKKASPCKRTCAEPDPTCIAEFDESVVRPGCVCPPEKPLEYNGVCTTAGWCPQAHMTQCSHLHCRYDGSRVQVHHNGLEQKGEKHYCRHSKDLYGGCHCLCYHDQLQPPKGQLADSATAWYKKSLKSLESAISAP